MRLSTLEKPSFIVRQGKMVGISLGNGGCAEHDSAYASMKSLMGVGEGLFSLHTKGEKRYKASRVPEVYFYSGYQDETSIVPANLNDPSQMPVGILSTTKFTDLDDMYARIQILFRDSFGDELTASWNGGEFMICAFGLSNIGKLKKLISAFGKNDVAVLSEDETNLLTDSNSPSLMISSEFRKLGLSVILDAGHTNKENVEKVVPEDILNQLVSDGVNLMKVRLREDAIVLPSSEVIPLVQASMSP